MEKTFYDRSGRPVAYSEDGTHIHGYSGHALGHVHEDSIYDYSGKHLGWFIDGWVRDHSGRCVFFTDEASGDPVMPWKGIQPTRVVKQIPPAKGVKKAKPGERKILPFWSALTGVQFFEWYCSL
jgi:hypothetical protein